MMKNLELDLSQVKLVPYDPSYSGFYNGDVDVTAAYLTGGVIKMRSKGIKLNLVWPGDYGVYFYSDIIVTLEKTIIEKPELVERFLRAALKGWNEAIGNSEMALKATLAHVSVKECDIQRSMLESLIPMVHTGQDHIGWMHRADWVAMYDILYDQNMLSSPLDPDKAFTLTFLQKIYGRKTP